MGCEGEGHERVVLCLWSGGPGLMPAAYNSYLMHLGNNMNQVYFSIVRTFTSLALVALDVAAGNLGFVVPSWTVGGESGGKRSLSSH